MTTFLLEIPNAVQLDGGALLFVQDAESVAAKLGRNAVSAMPPEYEKFSMRRSFWVEMGLHYDELPRGEIEEAILFRRLERAHPQRFKNPKGA